MATAFRARMSVSPLWLSTIRPPKGTGRGVRKLSAVNLTSALRWASSAAVHRQGQVVVQRSCSSLNHFRRDHGVVYTNRYVSFNRITNVLLHAGAGCEWRRKPLHAPTAMQDGMCIWPWTRNARWRKRRPSTRAFRTAKQRPALFGVPVAVKDCFDVAGYPTTCGSRFYAEKNGIARTDSTVAARLRQAGAVIMGKTHLHQLAYGITGENSEYGDCLQPKHPQLLTGGSSSGSAASVQEGSAVAAIGTDTGGSIRVPAALCGLAGYRSSLGLGGAGSVGGRHASRCFL